MEKSKNPLLANNTEYLSRIVNNYGLLSSSEKKIADYIIKNKSEIVNMSISILAEKSGTSPATITRFCRTLGFKGYNELKFYVERELLSPVGQTEQINIDDSVKILKQKIFKYDKEIIDDTLTMLDDDQVEKAIEVMSTALKINLYGEGGSGFIAEVGNYLFLQIGLPCDCFNDSFLQIASAAQIKKNEVAFGISYTGEVTNTVNAMKVAKQNGATTICITGYIDSSITKYSDIILYVSPITKPFLCDLPAARMSELCVINVLQVGILVKNYEKLSGNIEKYKEAFKLQLKKQ